MKNLMFVILLLSSFIVNAQDNLNLLPTLSAASVNSEPTAKIGAAAQLNLQDTEHLIRFQLGYDLSFTDKEVLNLQQFYLESYGGTKAWTWLKFMLGFGLSYQKRDWDGEERFKHRRKFITEPYFIAAIELEINQLQALFYYNQYVDENLELGLRLSYPFTLFVKP